MQMFRGKEFFLETFADKLEKDIEVLEAQIQSQIFYCQNQSLEILFLLKQEVVVLSSVVNIEDWFDMESNHKQFNHDNQIAKYLEGYHTDYDFYDLVSVYMEKKFSLNFQLCFNCGDKMHHELHSPLYCLVFILLKHNQKAMVSDQLLDWLHWNFSII
jgi:hypothetical protein